VFVMWIVTQPSLGKGYAKKKDWPKLVSMNVSKKELAILVGYLHSIGANSPGITGLVVV
jgi:hypothetical protein